MTLGLSQDTYIKKMLKRYHMHDCKPLDTLVEKNLSLNLDMCPKTPNEKKIVQSTLLQCCR